MSSREPPPLPATSDPFQLLGIEPGVSELDAKRAYVRKIKTYRPEKFPEEFQRLHRAYEEVRQLIEWGWENYQPPESREPAEATDELDEGWGDGEGDWDDELLGSDEEDELEAFAKEPGSTWHVLRQKLPLETATEVYELRVEDQLARDRVRELLDEMLHDPSLANDLILIGQEELEATVMCAVFAGVWVEPERTRRLLDKLGDCLGGYAGELYAEVASFAPRLERMQVPAPLARLLRLYPVLGWEQQEEIREQVRADVAVRPSAYLQALDRMAADSPLMLAFLVQQIGYGADVRSRSPGSREAGAIEQAMHEIDDHLQHSQHQGLYGALVVLAVGLVGIAFRSSLGLGVAALAAVAVAAIGLMARAGQTYRKRVRPALCEVVVAHGTAPSRFAQWLENNGTYELYRHADAIADDTGLDVLGALVRFARDDD